MLCCIALKGNATESGPRENKLIIQHIAKSYNASKSYMYLYSILRELSFSMILII